MAGRRDTDAILLVAALVLFPSFVDGFFRRELAAYSQAAYWGFDFLKFVVVPFIGIAVLARRYLVRPRDLGLRAIAEHETWLHFIALIIFLAFVLDIVYYVAVHVAWAMISPHIPIAREPGFYHSISPQGWLRLPVALYLAVTAAFVEEIFCRALPYYYLRLRRPDAFPRAAYILGTAALFALLHWENGPHELVGTFAFGVLAAAMYLELRDLWPLIGAHFVIDLGVFS